MNKLIVLATAIGLTLNLAGCGSDPRCKDICEKTNDCAGAEQHDCAEDCGNEERRNDTLGCVDEYDDLLVCLDRNIGEACNFPNGVCNTESTAYAMCIGVSCAESPTDKICAY